jgi:hypothetical protein
MFFLLLRPAEDDPTCADKGSPICKNLQVHPLVAFRVARLCLYDDIHFQLIIQGRSRPLTVSLFF